MGRNRALSRLFRLPEMFGAIGVSPRRWLSPPNREPKEATLFVFGQSHSVALRYAWEQRRFRPDSDAMDFKFVLSSRTAFRGDALVVTSPETGADLIHPELAAAFEQYAVLSCPMEAWLISVVRGNDYNVFGLFEPDPPFDFVHPALPDLPLREDVPTVPYDVVKAKFTKWADNTRRFLKALPRDRIAGIVHVEAPPPIPSTRQVERSVEQTVLKQVLNRPTATVSSREFRMKLYLCQVEVNRQVCAETNVIYVTPPEEAIDKDGYLRPKAWQGATHASAWYGALALKKIERVIAAERARRQ